MEQFVAWIAKDVGLDKGTIRLAIEAYLNDVAVRVQHDAELRTRVNCWLAENARSLTERYKHEVGRFVAMEVTAWDTGHAVRTMELSIGRDLPFIRVNGALVGGLLGLLIFSLTEWVWS